jgi:hypothetical protein
VTRKHKGKVTGKKLILPRSAITIIAKRLSGKMDVTKRLAISVSSRSWVRMGHKPEGFLLGVILPIATAT